MASQTGIWAYTSPKNDGHERQDVVQHRSEFLSNLLELDKITITPSNLTPLCLEGVKPLIRVVHDESTYYANCDQSYFWGDEHTNVLKQKSLGQSIMVSDFVMDFYSLMIVKLML